MKFTNRESWLNYVAMKMAPMFEAAGRPLPDRIRIAIGFTSSGQRGRAIGECWDHRCSEDGHFEIFIKPTIHEALEVSAILAHELCHAAVGIPLGHGKEFAAVARGVGLIGKMRSTEPGPVFIEAIAPILLEAGPLPHAKLDKDRRGSGTRGEGELEREGPFTTAPKRQRQNHVKCQCSACKYIARTSRKWLLSTGAPHCPLHGAMEVLNAEDLNLGEVE